jgi:hypothetical protein
LGFVALNCVHTLKACHEHHSLHILLHGKQLLVLLPGLTQQPACLTAERQHMPPQSQQSHSLQRAFLLSNCIPNEERALSLSHTLHGSGGGHGCGLHYATTTIITATTGTTTGTITTTTPLTSYAAANECIT